MEGVKLRYLQKLLRRRKDSVDKFVKAMKKVEGKARGCYAEPISLSPDQFVEMLVLDGCFIIELFRRHAMPGLRDNDDFYFQTSELQFDIIRDLVLVENQLPFFVLTILFDMTKSEDPRDNINRAALGLLTEFIPCEIEQYLDECDDDIGDIGNLVRCDDDIGNIDHLVCLVHKWSCFSFTRELELRRSATELKEEGVKLTDVEAIDVYGVYGNIKHLVCLVHKGWCSAFAKILSGRDLQDKQQNLKLTKSATELKEAGVKFKKAETNIKFDIVFLKGVMEIPCLTVDDKTEFLARNLIAYEQYLPHGHPKYVTDYYYFIDYLVNSSKDVKILREEGIIDNWLGNDETVATLFNRLGDETTVNMNWYYRKIFSQVNKHCMKRGNRWMANLKHNYFNTPWSSISVLAAAALLLLTVVQTAFSITK
ncbi:hypothetical protein NMG60_11029632 [Bertholletia excelsa]